VQGLTVASHGKIGGRDAPTRVRREGSIETQRMTGRARLVVAISFRDNQMQDGALMQAARVAAKIQVQVERFTVSFHVTW
jgi:hypothetical protein